MSASLADVLCWRSVGARHWFDDDFWSGAGAPADCFFPDLATERNVLSVFLVPKADADEHAKRIAAAMAAKMRKLVVRYEYILFDAARLDTAGVRIENRPGETPDAVVNTWHRDLTVLSADQLADIAEAMWDARETMGFHLDDELAELIAGGINGHQLDPGMIKQGILDPLRHRGLIG